MQARDYQIKARKAIHGEWEIGRKRTMMILPTGCGKTVVAAEVTKDQVDAGEKVLFVAHRVELLNQAMDKIKSVSGIDCALEKAESTSVGSLFPVTVGSIQTLCRTNRLERFDPDYFGTIIVDEAHHVMSDSYQGMLDYFGGAKVLGMTATADRSDKKNLGEFFNSCAFEYSMRQAIKDKWLCPIKAQMIPLELDLSKVKMSQGDYSLGDTAHALEPYLEQIAVQMTKYCADRKTVVFLPLVRISQEFTAILNRCGFNAIEVNGNSPDREQILTDFDAGYYNVLCNSMLLTEGWDCPSVDCIVVLRPTKSRGLYQQMIGRGTRLYPGKEDLLVLDFLWLTEEHDLCRPSSLSDKEDKIRKKLDEKVKDADGEVDIFGVEDEVEKEVMDEEAAVRESTLAKRLAMVSNRRGKSVDPIQYAFSIAAEDLAYYEPSFGWQAGPPSEKQLALLEGRGIDITAVENAGMASLLIDRLLKRQSEGLSTPKQIRKLEQFGFQHVGTWSFDAASNMITRISRAGWGIPRGVNPRTYVPE